MFLIGPKRPMNVLRLQTPGYALDLTSINKFDIEIKHNEADTEKPH